MRHVISSRVFNFTGGRSPSLLTIIELLATLLAFRHRCQATLGTLIN